MVEDLGGKATPAIGFAAGLERIALILEEQKEKLVPKVDLYLANPDEAGYVKCLQLCNDLRMRGIRAEMDLQSKSFKAQMKRANKLMARYVLIIGQQELDNNLVILKDMQEGTQEEIIFTRLEDELKTRFPKSANYPLS